MEKKNNLDPQYNNLLKDILENGVKKQTRNGEVLSVFGRQIRHNMRDGFSLLTGKKMAWKSIVTELLWFLRGDTNIKYLLQNDCNIWTGDAYKNFEKHCIPGTGKKMSKEEFINKIKTDDEFAKKWGDLGPVYGKQWRSWDNYRKLPKDEYVEEYRKNEPIDQIANLINDLKTNPDSRRLMVSAWNVGELDQMVLPPCHYGFQVYTRELSLEERLCIADKINKEIRQDLYSYAFNNPIYTGGIEQRPDDVERHYSLNVLNIPHRAISLMFNQRSVDTPLGLPFNIASYGLLLEIIAKMVNMVPDELIGNLGDCHIYTNQIDGVKEQIGRELSWEERVEIARKTLTKEEFFGYGNLSPFTTPIITYWLNQHNIPNRTRQPYPLPTLNINTEFWPTQSGECGVGELTDNIDFLIKEMRIDDFQIENYKSHPAIKMPLSN